MLLFIKIGTCTIWNFPCIIWNYFRKFSNVFSIIKFGKLLEHRQTSFVFWWRICYLFACLKIYFKYCFGLMLLMFVYSWCSIYENWLGIVLFQNSTSNRNNRSTKKADNKQKGNLINIPGICKSKLYNYRIIRLLLKFQTILLTS